VLFPIAVTALLLPANDACYHGLLCWFCHLGCIWPYVCRSGSQVPAAGDLIAGDAEKILIERTCFLKNCHERPASKVIINVVTHVICQTNLLLSM
jgi:hypothetical protein